jgi:hypothetical protein
VDPTRGRRQRRDLLTILARMPVNRAHGVDALVSSSEAHRKSGTTTYLVTPRNITMSLGEAARGGTIILSPATEQARAWFTFDPAVDFATCSPVETPGNLKTKGTRNKQ